MDFTSLERDVLDWMARKNGDPALERQLAAAVAVSREWTGVGSYTELSVPRDLPRVGYRVCPVCPGIESAELESGAVTVLFCEDGFAATLELASCGDTFPVELKAWRLVGKAG